MSEQMRKEFEEWFGGEKPILVGEHADMFERVFWHVWQSSRQSLVVKLPEYEKYKDTQDYFNACMVAINEAGVDYK